LIIQKKFYPVLLKHQKKFKESKLAAENSTVPILIHEKISLHEVPKAGEGFPVPAFNFILIDHNSLNQDLQIIKQFVLNTIDNALVHRSLDLALEYREKFLFQKPQQIAPILTLDGYAVLSNGVIMQLQQTPYCFGAPDLTLSAKWLHSVSLLEKMIYAMCIYSLISFKDNQK